MMNLPRYLVYSAAVIVSEKLPWIIKEFIRLNICSGARIAEELHGSGIRATEFRQLILLHCRLKIIKDISE